MGIVFEVKEISIILAIKYHFLVLEFNSYKFSMGCKKLTRKQGTEPSSLILLFLAVENESLRLNV